MRKVVVLIQEASPLRRDLRNLLHLRGHWVVEADDECSIRRILGSIQADLILLGIAGRSAGALERLLGRLQADDNFRKAPLVFLRPGMDADVILSEVARLLPEPASFAVSSKRRPVLIVEDDPDICEAEKDVLLAEGHEVHTARNGREALSVLEQLQQPCVILLDLMMPVMDGLQFLEHLQGSGEPSKHAVIVVSANTRAAHSAKELGAVAFLPKPFDLGSLIHFVEQHHRA